MRARRRIEDALERWNIKQRKKGALMDYEKEWVRQIFQDFLVMLEWNEKRGEIDVVILDKKGKETG